MIILILVLLLTTIFSMVWVWRLACNIDELKKLLKQRETEIKQLKRAMRDSD